MNRSVTFTRPELVRVQSRGWLLGKLGVAVLVVAGAILVWGPLVIDRPHAMRLVGLLGWAAIALLALGAVVRVAEAAWGTVCTAYVLGRSVVSTATWTASAIGRAARSLARSWRRPVALLAIAVLVAPSGASGYAMIVLDPTNLIQNTISAMKAIESVINEVQMITNQIKADREHGAEHRQLQRRLGPRRAPAPHPPGADHRPGAGDHIRDVRDGPRVP